MIEEKIISKIRASAAPFILYGMKGTGKRYNAVYVSKLLLCETENACGKCGECVRIEKNTHPNVIIIEPENKDIKIEKIREVIGGLVFAAAEGRKRIVIIDDAHRLNQYSANALLKTLEEPPADTVFFLLSSNLNRMLPTIISRCELVRFPPMNPDRIADILGISPDHPLLKFSMGSVSRIKFFLANEDVIRRLAGFVEKPVDNYYSISRLCGELVDICNKDMEAYEYVISLILHTLLTRGENMISQGQDPSPVFTCINAAKAISNRIYYNTSPSVVFENMLLELT
ncbi:MAG: DNA polymerase III subunit [Oligoflexia bacterium]|nr:DNA polymerase III subunit [Oligoflexia bacterium]